MNATCLFCGTSGSVALTNEHINPNWLLSYLGLPDNDRLFQGVASSETGELVEPPRIHSSYQFVQGRVCGVCNSGWMSRLENAAKPVLTALMNQERTVQSLQSVEAALIAKWAAKTAYLHSWAGPFQRPVQRPHLQNLHGDGGTVTPGVGVFAMQSDFVQPTAYIQTGHWPQFASGNTSPDEQTPDAAYKVGLQFRHLYFLVAYWPNPASIFVRVRGMHIRLFPDTRESGLEYPIEPSLGAGPLNRLVAFANSLAIFHPEGAV